MYSAPMTEFKQLQVAARSGDAEAQFTFGVAYANGSI